MGLDMYLTGEKFIYSHNGSQRDMEDGFPISSKELQIGYWRKHPNLHGFMVQTFAEGKDDCQRIQLDAADLKTIMAAVAADQLPFTQGFFFGMSDGTEKQETLDILNAALEWLQAPHEEGVMRSVYYRASW